MLQLPTRCLMAPPSSRPQRTLRQHSQSTRPQRRFARGALLDATLDLRPAATQAEPGAGVRLMCLGLAVMESVGPLIRIRRGGLPETVAPFLRGHLVPIRGAPQPFIVGVPLAIFAGRVLGPTIHERPMRLPIPRHAFQKGALRTSRAPSRFPYHPRHRRRAIGAEPELEAFATVTDAADMERPAANPEASEAPLARHGAPIQDRKPPLILPAPPLAPVLF